MWQKIFEKHLSEGFTVVGIAMDSEGVEAAKRQYERAGVTFHALIDPNYATQFAYVPWTFFVDEHGVVQGEEWEDKIKPSNELRPVTQEIREQWTPTGARLDPKAVAALVRKHEETPRDLAIASELASRYIALNRKTEAAAVIEKVVSHYDSLAIARGNDESLKQMLSAAYLQLSRAETQKDAQVIAAQLAYNISPTVGYVKQVVRLTDPSKFDDTSDGKMDDQYRSSGIKEVEAIRKAWLEEE